MFPIGISLFVGKKAFEFPYFWGLLWSYPFRIFAVNSNHDIVKIINPVNNIYFKSVLAYLDRSVRIFGKRYFGGIRMENDELDPDDPSIRKLTIPDSDSSSRMNVDNKYGPARFYKLTN